MSSLRSKDYNIYKFRNICSKAVMSFLEDGLCPSDFRLIPQYYKAINDIRRDYTFPTFVNRTNEKDQTIQVSSAFLDDYLPKFITQCNVLDIGVGEGTLSSKVATYMKGKCNDISYNGIDRSEKFVNLTKNKLFTLDISNQNIIVGDCFGGDIDSLVDYPTVLIASQVLFYAPNISEFIGKLISKMGAIAFVIGQSDFSFLNEMNSKYAGSYKQKSTESQLRLTLSNEKRVNSINILYNSFIEFPKIKSLSEIAYKPYESIEDESERVARNILEFVSGSPLEYLEQKKKLDSFISDVSKHLERNNNIAFWNFMQTIVPDTQMTKEDLYQRWLTIQKQKFSKDITHFSHAINEGNSEIVKEMLKNGVVLPDIQEEKKEKSWAESIMLEFFLYLELLPLPKLNYGLDAENLYQKQNHYFIQALRNQDQQITNYLFDKLHEANSQKIIDYWEESISCLDYKYSYMNHNIVGLIYFYVITPFLISFDVSFLSIWGAGSSAVFAYTAYKNYNAGRTILYYLASFNETTVLEHFLKYKNVTSNINIQSPDNGKTALHLSSKNSHTEVSYLLLEQPNIKIDINDHYGKLPIHYAVENNNILLLQLLLEKNDHINSTVFNHQKYSFDFSMKSVMLYMTFDLVDLNIKDLNYVKFIGSKLLWANILGYAIGRGNIRIPETIHYKFFMWIAGFFGGDLYKYSTDDSYFEYSNDTALHITTRNNYTKLSSYLISRDIYTDPKNIDLIAPIHYAAANNNIELIELLSSHGVEINHHAKKDYSVYYYGLLLYALSGFIGNVYDLFAKLYVWHVFHDEAFKAFRGKDSGTTLHFAAAGQVDIPKAIALLSEKKFLDLDRDRLKSETIELLLEKGVDPDADIVFIENQQFLVISLTFFLKATKDIVYIKSATNFVSALFFYSISILSFPKILNIKPIDLVEKYVVNKNYYYSDRTKISESYKLLKQYTDSVGTTWFGLKYTSYILNFLLGNDKIIIDEYGMYKGGIGNDVFYVSKYYKGKEEGHRIIINNYERGEQIVLDKSFGDLDIESLDLSNEDVMGKDSTIISLDTGEEILTLWGYDLEDVDDIKVETSFDDVDVVVGEVSSHDVL